MTPPNFSFSFGHFHIDLAIIIVFLGVFSSIWVLSRTVHEKGLSLKFLNDHIFFFTLFSLTAGRIGMMQHLELVLSEKLMMAETFGEKIFTYLEVFTSVWQGGINFYWALGGFLISFILMCFWKNQRVMSWFDAFSLPILLFLLFLELGSFLAGWGYGKPVNEDFFLAVEYGQMDILYAGTLHPVQLYAATLYLLLFIIGIFLWSRKLEDQWDSGVFGSILLIVLFVINGGIEFFREETSIISQIIFFVFAFLILLFMMWKGHLGVFSKPRIIPKS